MHLTGMPVLLDSAINTFLLFPHIVFLYFYSLSLQELSKLICLFFQHISSDFHFNQQIIYHEMGEILYFLVIIACRYVLKVRNPKLFNPDVSSEQCQGEKFEALTWRFSDEIFNASQVSLLCYVILVNHKDFNEEVEGTRPELIIREILVNVDGQLLHFLGYFSLFDEIIEQIYSQFCMVLILSRQVRHTAIDKLHYLMFFVMVNVGNRIPSGKHQQKIHRIQRQSLQFKQSVQDDPKL